MKGPVSENPMAVNLLKPTMETAEQRVKSA